MSDKILGLYLEQIAQRLHDDIQGLKEHIPPEDGENMLGAPMKVWPMLGDLEVTQHFVDDAATVLIGDTK